MKTLRFLRSLSGRIRVCGVAITLLLCSLAVDAAIPPLPPLPETFPGTLPTDQFAVESPPEVVAQAPDEDTSWLESGSGETAKNQFRLPVRHVTVAADGTLVERSA